METKQRKKVDDKQSLLINVSTVLHFYSYFYVKRAPDAFKGHSNEKVCVFQFFVRR